MLGYSYLTDRFHSNNFPCLTRYPSNDLSRPLLSSPIDSLYFPAKASFTLLNRWSLPAIMSVSFVTFSHSMSSIHREKAWENRKGTQRKLVVLVKVPSVGVMKTMFFPLSSSRFIGEFLFLIHVVREKITLSQGNLNFCSFPVKKTGWRDWRELFKKKPPVVHTDGRGRAGI